MNESKNNSLMLLMRGMPVISDGNLVVALVEQDCEAIASLVDSLNSEIQALNTGHEVSLHMPPTIRLGSKSNTSAGLNSHIRLICA